MSEKSLDDSIEEATVDCHDYYECLEGFCTTLEDKFKFPFDAEVVGENVKVVGLEEDANTIDAICKRNGKKYNVNLLNIKYDPKKVKGSRWIEVYKEWASHQ